jgi:hypothetical protein
MFRRNASSRYKDSFLSLNKKIRWNLKADSRSSGQESLLLLYEPKFHYCFIRTRHCSYPQEYFIQFFLTWFFLTIHLHAILPSPLRIGLPKSLFPASWSTKILYKFLVSPKRSIFHTHLTVLNVATLIVCDVKWNLWSPHYAVFLNRVSFP